MARAADELVEARPYLAAAQPGPRTPPGAFDGGFRGSASERLVLTRDEVARMTPEQVAAAIGRGQVPGVLGGHR